MVMSLITLQILRRLLVFTQIIIPVLTIRRGEWPVNFCPADATVKILFVDDEPNVLRALRRLFMEDENYELLTAESGEEGLKILEQVQGVCVVVSDYRMPAMNGVEFLRRVHDLWPNTVRIVLSGYADTAAVVEAINVGHIYKFIPKPWNDSELRVNIANAADTCYLNRENERLSQQLQQRNLELSVLNFDLEEEVQQRMAELQMRSQILQLAQEILDSLPVAVLGVDSDGMVVQANVCAAKLWPATAALLGEQASAIFPAELLAFLKRVQDSGRGMATLNCSERTFLASGCYLNDDQQRGVVITLQAAREDL